MSEFVRRAAEGSLPAADLTGTVTFRPISARRLRRIERQRTQSVPSASRATYRVSGKPTLAEPGVWKTLALYNMASSTPEDR